MPPPSWTGISSPTSARIAFTAASLTGLPAKAPLRSTRCRRRAPASSQRRAIAAGLSLKIVDSLMSPWRRRTQCPSFRSIAGISSMAGANGEERSEGRTGPRLSRRPGSSSRCPVEEVAVERQAMGGALLGVELRRENVTCRQRRGKAAAVICFTDTVARVGRARIEAVNEIEVAGVGNAAPERVRARLDDLVPAHLRHLEAAAVFLEPTVEAKADHLAGDQPQARRPAGGLAFLAALEQHLHADTDAEQGLACGGLE